MVMSLEPSAMVDYFYAQAAGSFKGWLNFMSIGVSINRER